MKKLVYSAFALSLTSVVGLTAPNDWSTLDREVEALTSSLAQDGTMTLGGWVFARYDSSGDIPVGMNDLGGFGVQDARLYMKGNTGDYGYKVEYDFDSTTFLDGYMSFPIGSVVGTVGQFKPPVLGSALVSRKNLLFMQRTANGETWSGRDTGLMVSGEFDTIGWWVSIMNGSDSVGDELFFSGRVAIDLMGDGTGGDTEGSYGGSESPSASAAVAFWDDGQLNDGDGFVGEANLGTNVYSVGIEMVSYGKDGYSSAGLGGGPTGSSAATINPAISFADATPFAVWGSYMLTPDTWEVAVRFQDFDDVDNSDAVEVAVNRYMQGHDAKWTLQYITTSSDIAANEVDIISGGLLVSM